MATPDDDFQKVLADFTKKLKLEERAEFKVTTLAELEKVAYELQEAQRKTKTARNLKKIEPFLQAMSQYKGIIEVFLNASSLLCFVWGPMKSMLLIASNWSKAFDILLEAYKQIAENFPLLFKYRSLFGENNHMRKILVWLYQDILNFHIRALRIFSQRAWRQLFTATWKDFQESFKPILGDILRHRELIESTASLEQLQEARDARLQSQTKFAAIELGQNHKRMLDVIHWLSAADSDADQEVFTSTRHDTDQSTGQVRQDIDQSTSHDIPQTGHWIFDEIRVKKWLDPNQSSVPTIWLNGKPGAGKTILSSVIVEKCSKIIQSENQVSLAFFYCRDQDGQRNKFSSVVKTMLAQLLRQNPTLLPYLYDECIKSAKVTLESSKDCVELLSTVLKAVPKAFLVIDGIDECETKERKAILNFFTSMIERDDVEPGQLRCIFVSQELGDIKSALHMAEILRLTKERNELDIKNFVVMWAFRIQKKFSLMPYDARDHIVKLVYDGADGMFLFARLVLENLHCQESLENVYRELRPDTFPAGFDQAYARIVHRIFENPNHAQRETAQKLLGWITFSKRPMKWHEIQGATSINLPQREVNFEGRQIEYHVRDICGSLVEILPGDRVELVHTTARHYLIHEKRLDVKKEETNLAALCMQYLTFDCFGDNLSNDDVSRFVESGHYAFLDYASLHWYHHLDIALASLIADDIGPSTQLGGAINEFFEVYEPGPDNEDKFQEEYLQRCSALEKAGCHESLILLLAHSKTRRLAEEKLEALDVLGSITMKVRKILEDLGSCQTLALDRKQNLQQIYGHKWYKCSRHTCYYFHEGFSNERGLSRHIDRHEKPFCCTEMNCTRMYIGWATEKELKKHMNQYHPDPEAFSWKFPHVKKPPTKYPCSECEKTYTRASSLNTHQLREHANERPFLCETCAKGFVRKYELDRHESTHKSKSKAASQAQVQSERTNHVI